MIPAWLAPLAPSPLVLGAALALDLAIGDPAYAAHPVRLIGATIAAVERALRRLGLDGYGGGVLLAIVVAALWVGAGVRGGARRGARARPGPRSIVHAFVVYSLLALGDLLRHVWRVERALGAGDLDGARAAVGALVVRDADRLDAAACRRAAIESLAENLTDGVTSAVCWYAVGGVPGLVLFKVASTLDSMVGNRTPRYLRFGWAGARLDDVMNYVPARLTWLLLAITALVVPGCAAADALVVGARQHAILPGPELRLERGRGRRRAAAAAGRADLAARHARHRAVDRPARTIRPPRAAPIWCAPLRLIAATGVLATLLAMAVLAAA